MSNKWIAWHGLTNEAPVTGKVNVLFRDGDKYNNEDPKSLKWMHDSECWDITAYQTANDEFKEVPKHSHYHKDVSHLKTIDVYRVMELWDVTSPSLQHAIKKLLVPGGRGAGKDMAKDIQETIDSLIRWQEMQVEDSLAKDQQEC